MSSLNTASIQILHQTAASAVDQVTDIFIWCSQLQQYQSGNGTTTATLTSKGTTQAPNKSCHDEYNNCPELAKEKCFKYGEKCKKVK